MSKVSQKTIDRLKEEILSLLYHKAPVALFTNKIANELIRDEEFIKNLLLELKKQDLVKEIKKSQNGQEYSRRRRWSLSHKAFEAYKGLSE